MGRKLEGNLPRAHEVQGTARLLVQQCINEIKYRGGWGQACRQLALRDGTIVKAIVIQNIRGFEPIVRVEVFAPHGAPGEEPPITYLWLATVWKPEGLVITPSNSSAKAGWGFPKRDRLTGELINPPYGTPIREDSTATGSGNRYGSCNQVILNKFANNKYLDHPDFISGLPEGFVLPDNPRLRASLEEPLPQGGLGFYVTWPAAYEPVDVARLGESVSVWEAVRGKAFDDRPGYRLGLLPYFPTSVYQLDDNGEDLLYESETATWYAHWPEELLYDTDAAEVVFQFTNESRLAAGVDPLSRHIRGFHDPGVLLANEVYLSKVMAHEDDEAFRPGRADPNDRFGSYMRMLGENNAMAVGEFYGRAIGESLVEQWRNSPGHYSNMVHEAWSNPLGHLAVTTRPDVSINRWHLTNEDAPGEEAAFTGTLAVATHYAPRNNTKPTPIRELDAGSGGFVAAGLLYNLHNQGRVGWSRPYPGTFVSYPALEETKLGRDCVYFRNRKYRVSIPEIDPDLDIRSVVVGASAFEDGGLLWLRAVLCVVIRSIDSSSGFPVPKDVQTAELRCLKWPVRATENLDTDSEETTDVEFTPWIVESMLPLAVFPDVLSTDTLRNAAPAVAGALAFTSTPCVFLPDGSEGRFTYPILRLSNAGEFIYPEYPVKLEESNIDEAPNATPLFWTLAEIEVVNGQLALRREILGPELVMDIEYECEPDYWYGGLSAYRPMKVTQSCVGEVDVFPLVRDGKFVYARYEFDMHIEQRYPSNWATGEAPPPDEAVDAHRREWLHLPSGHSLQTVEYEIVKGFQTAPIFLRSVDHISLDADDFAYREAKYTQTGSTQATLVRYWYANGVLTHEGATSWPITNQPGGNTLTTRPTRPFSYRGYLSGGFHLPTECPEDLDDPDTPAPDWKNSIEYGAGDPYFSSPHRQFLVFSSAHMADVRGAIILELQGYAGAVNASNAPNAYFVTARLANNMRVGLCFNLTQGSNSMNLGVTGYSPPINPTEYYNAPFMVSALKFDFTGSQFARYKEVFLGAQAKTSTNVHIVSDGIDDIGALLGVTCTDLRPMGVL